MHDGVIAVNKICFYVYACPCCNSYCGQGYLFLLLRISHSCSKKYDNQKVNNFDKMPNLVS